MIDLNVRSIKKVEGNYQLTVNRSLCGHCGNQEDCQTLEKITSIEDAQSVTTQVRSCPDYLFPLMFQNAAGTASSFNTIRLGSTWGSRVERGDVIALISKKSGVFGFATVKSVKVGEKDDIILKHAYKNHLYMGSGMKKKDAGEHLLSKMPSIYGNLIVKNNSTATVIYLENCSIIKP